MLSKDFPESLGQLILSYAIEDAKEIGNILLLRHGIEDWLQKSLSLIRIHGRKSQDQWDEAATALSRLQPKGIYVFRSNAPTYFLQSILSFVEIAICAKSFNMSSTQVLRGLSAHSYSHLVCLHIGENEFHGYIPESLPNVQMLGLTNGKHDPSWLLAVTAVQKTPKLKLLLLGGCFFNEDWLPVLEYNLFNTSRFMIELTFISISLQNKTIDLTKKETIAALPDSILRLFPAPATMAIDARKQQPLHKAAQTNDSILTKYLLDMDADVLARDVHGATPAFRASEHGALDVLGILLNLDQSRRQAQLSLGNHRNECCLYIAATKGHTQAVIMLLEAEDLPLDLVLERRADNENFTPLHAAVIGRHFDVLTLFLSLPHCKACVDFVNRYQQTALHLAARAGISLFAEALLQAGANPNLRDDRGWTTLDVCLAFQHRTKDHGTQCAKRLSLAGAKHAGVPPRRKHHQRRPPPSFLHLLPPSSHHGNGPPR